MDNPAPLETEEHSKAEALRDEYRLRFSPQEDYRNEVWKILASRFFSRYVARDAAVLDLGCGWGEFINNIEAGARFGMDLNPDAEERLDPGVPLYSQDCSHPWPVEPGSLDVVFTSNFFEHLPDKNALDLTLHEAMKALKPGGRLVCLGPNIACVKGAYWHFYDHFVPLTDLSLAEALTLTGFEIEEKIPRFLPYTMSGKKPPPLAFLKPYLSFRPAWRIFGKQFLVVGRKPA